MIDDRVAAGPTGAGTRRRQWLRLVAALGAACVATAPAAQSLARPAAQDHRRRPRRKLARRPRPRHRRKAQGPARPAGDRREQAGRGRHGGDRGGGQGPGRRLRDGARLQRSAGIRPAAAEAALRRAEGSRAGDHHLEPAQRAGRQRAAAGEERAGARRLREGQSRQAELCVGRQRQLVAPQHGAAEVGRRLRRGAHPVQRLAARGDRDGPGRDADDVRGDAAAAAAGPGREAARARGDDRQALPAAAGPADDRRGRLSGIRGAGVERPAGRGRHAGAGRRPAQRRDQRDPEACPTSWRGCTPPAST